MNIEPPQPARWDPAGRVWIISRYPEVIRVLRPGASAVIEMGYELAKLSTRLNGAFPQLVDLLHGTPLLQNGDIHVTSRAALKSFIADMSRRWTPERIDREVVRLLARARSGESQDVIPLIAETLPESIIAEALGLAPQTVHWLSHHARNVARAWEPLPLREYKDIENSVGVLLGFFSQHGEIGRHAGEATGKLAHPFPIFIVIAGIETTAGFIGNAMHLLAEHPTLQDRLRNEPGRVNDFVEEALRFCGPVRRLAGRITRGEIELGGRLLPAGASLIMDVERAHRDPVAYSEPDQFNLDRVGPPSIAFGGGGHTCLGMALARLELRVLIGRLLCLFRILPGRIAPRPRSSRNWRQFEALELTLERLIPLDARSTGSHGV